MYSGGENVQSPFNLWCVMRAEVVAYVLIVQFTEDLDFSERSNAAKQRLVDAWDLLERRSLTCPRVYHRPEGRIGREKREGRWERREGGREGGREKRMFVAAQAVERHSTLLPCPNHCICVLAIVFHETMDLLGNELETPQLAFD